MRVSSGEAAAIRSCAPIDNPFTAESAIDSDSATYVPPFPCANEYLQMVGKDGALGGGPRLALGVLESNDGEK